MLELQLNRCEAAFKDALTLNQKADSLRRTHHLEGSLSDAWQAYCAFVRNVCIRSSIGCTTASGTVHAACVVPPSSGRVSHIALRTAKNRPIQAGAVNAVLRLEPTWGDSSKIVDIINALGPGNAANLLGSFAGGLTGPKHCQTVRNACAHRNHQTKAEVEALAPLYIAGKVMHPTDALVWKEPANSDFAFVAWLDDMRTIAQRAVH
jgi:hypothetical protein